MSIAEGLRRRIMRCILCRGSLLMLFGLLIVLPKVSVIKLLTSGVCVGGRERERREREGWNGGERERERENERDKT